MGGSRASLPSRAGARRTACGDHRMSRAGVTRIILLAQYSPFSVSAKPWYEVRSGYQWCHLGPPSPPSVKKLGSRTDGIGASLLPMASIALHPEPRLRMCTPCQSSFPSFTSVCGGCACLLFWYNNAKLSWPEVYGSSPPFIPLLGCVIVSVLLARPVLPKHHDLDVVQPIP